MKLIIDVEKDYYEMIKYNVEHGQYYKPFEIIANGIPYNPTGDAISRKQVLDELMAHQYSQDFCKEHGIEYSINSSMVRIIVNGAQAVEHSLLPLASDLDSAYMRGYEVGKAEGILKAETRPKGEWICVTKGNLGINTYKCSLCGHLITCTERAMKQHYKGCYCGADMR